MVDVVRAEAAALLAQRVEVGAAAAGRTARSAPFRWRCPTPSRASASPCSWRASASSVWIARPRDGIGSTVWAKPTSSDCQDRCATSLGMRLVGDVQDHPAAVDPADIGAVRPFRRRPPACACGSRFRADPRAAAAARCRPGACRAATSGRPRSDARGSVHVHDHQELVVELVARGEVACAPVER